MAISPVQQTTVHAAAVTSQAFPAITVAAGDALIATISGNASVTSFGISDNQGNTWVKAIDVAAVPGVSNYYGIWYAFNCKVGSTTVTITSGASANFSCNLTEWPSLYALDGTGSNVIPATTMTVTVGPTTNADDLIVALTVAGGTNSPTSGPTNSFTALTNPSPATAPVYAGAYQVENAVGTYSTSWTYPSQSVGGVIAAFKIQENTPRRTMGQRRRVPHVKPKRTVRGNILAKAVPQPRPGNFPQPPAQRKRVPDVKAKRPVKGRITHRIPPRPFPERPYPKARPQNKRTPHVKPKRTARAGVIFRIPPAPFPNRTRLRPKPQAKRIPRVRPKRDLRSTLLQPRTPPSSPILRPRVQAKRIPRVRPKHSLRTRILASPVVAPVITALPLPIRSRAQPKRIPRVKAKRALSTRGLDATPTKRGLLPKAKPQRKRISGVRRRNPANASFRIISGVVPSAPILPLPVRSRRGQRKRGQRPFQRHATRFATPRVRPSPPTPPPPPFPTNWIKLYLTEPDTQPLRDAVFIFQERIESVTPSLMVLIYSSAATIPRNSDVTITAKVTLPDGVSGIPGMLPQLYIYEPDGTQALLQTMNPTGDPTIFQQRFYIQQTAPTGVWEVEVV